MLYLIAKDDAAYVLGLLLVLELRGVDADDYELVPVLLFEALQVRDDVHAVDAAVSPEVEQHDLAAQRRERERRVRVQPPAPAFEFGRTHAPQFTFTRHFIRAFLVLRARYGREHEARQQC